MANSNQKSILTCSVFSREYWAAATKELTSVKSLVFAALIIALRVAVKAFKIPVAAGVNFTFDCYVNAMGSVVYGPVVGLLVGAASDTLGCILFPSGTYFLPFILVEMWSSFIFGLFLWRRQITVPRVLISKFLINFVGNIVMNSVFMKWMYYALGDDKFYTYNLVNGVRVVKNLILFPLEAILIVILLSALIGTNTKSRFDWVNWNDETIQIQKRSIGLSLILSFLTLGIYGIYWKYLMAKNIRSIKKDSSSCVKEMLCLIFIPFYSAFWFYTQSIELKRDMEKASFSPVSSGVVNMILSILQLDLIALSIMQYDCNNLPTTKQDERERIGPLKQLGIIPKEQKTISLKTKDILLVVGMFILSVGLVLTYVFWLKDIINPPKPAEEPPAVTESATQETETAQSLEAITEEVSTEETAENVTEEVAETVTETAESGT